MYRFFLVLLILLVVLTGITVLFLLSPLPKTIAENVITKVYPKTGYFKIKQFQLIPWRPIEIKNVEYQLAKDPDEGILKVGTARLILDYKESIAKKRGLIELQDIAFNSQKMNLDDLDAEIPFRYSLVPDEIVRGGMISVKGLQYDYFKIKDVEVSLKEREGDYSGVFRGEWSGGAFDGDFDYQLFNNHKTKATLRIGEFDLSGLSTEVGGVFKRASGKCAGYLSVETIREKITGVEGELLCPPPGGKFRSKYLKTLAEWVPEGIAKDIFEQEIESDEDYYFDELKLKIKSHLPGGFWRFHLQLNNPKLHLDIPVDISGNTFETVLENKKLKSLIEKWSQLN